MNNLHPIFAQLLAPIMPAPPGAMWTLERGLDVARIIERKAIPAGYHCALGGSVMVNGFSMKDLDIILYLHTDKNWETSVKMTPEDFVRSLEADGFVPISLDRRNDPPSASDGHYKQVIRTKLGDKQVDFIFLALT